MCTWHCITLHESIITTKKIIDWCHCLTWVTYILPIQTGLINFDKRWKLFELLAQLTLYQKSAFNYQFPCHSGLTAWLQTTPTLTATERCLPDTVHTSSIGAHNNYDVHENEHVLISFEEAYSLITHPFNGAEIYCQWMISVPMNQCTNESVYQWISVPMNQCTNESVYKWISVQMNQCTNESVYKWISVQMNQCTNESVYQWISVPMNQCTNESVYQWISVPMAMQCLGVCGLCTINHKLSYRK